MLQYSFLAFFFYVFVCVSTEVYYIVPSYNESCAIEPCVTISHFAANGYVSSNMTLIFLPGSHTLNVDFWFADITELKMQAKFKTNRTEVHVLCEDSGYFDFQNIEYVLLNDLKLIGCFTQLFHVRQTLIEELVFIGKENSGTAIELSDSAATIVNSSFYHNRAHGLYRTYYSQWYLVAGVVLVTSSNLTVIKSTFEENTAQTGGVIYAEQNSNITLSTSAFIGNQIMCDRKICYGGVLYLNGGTLVVLHSTFVNNSAKGSLSSGGVFRLLDSTVSFSHSTFLQNVAEGIGGVISAKGGYVVLTSNKFNRNVATRKGGVFFTSETSLHCTYSNFSQNVADIGGVMSIQYGSVIISDNNFENNTARSNGGVISADETDVSVTTCCFTGNLAQILGGVIHLLDDSHLTMIDNEFIFNRARSGGVLSLNGRTNVIIIESRFINNKVDLDGGVLVVGGQRKTTISISECKFVQNSAKHRGGVLRASNLNVSLQSSTFYCNSADQEGGVLHARKSNIRFTVIEFSNNNASLGGVIYTVEKTNMQMENVTISVNTAKMGVLYLIETTGIFSGFSVFSDNLGTLFAINSFIRIFNSSKFVNCSKGISLRSDTTPTFQEGGAITSFQSVLYFYGTSTLEYNWSENGGAIHASESKLDILGEVRIVSNTASISGGGIYLYQSELQCHGRSTLQLILNSAIVSGGGINAISSSINVDFLWERVSTSEYLYTYGGSKVYFIQNTSKKGGGVCLSLNAKLYILKKTRYYEHINTFIFTKNIADYGGAIYVADETNSGTCGSTSYKIHSATTECFLQALSLHSQKTHIVIDTNFTNNLAKYSGSDLFGGLLDRCTISPFAEIYSAIFFSDYTKRFNRTIGGIDYLKYTSNINLTSVSSYPTKLCFCVNNDPDCDYKPPVKFVKKGQLFSIMVVAVDEVNRIINNVTIHTSLSSKQGGLGENQLSQTTNYTCTELKFQIYSPNVFEELVMYAEGPCKDAQLSKRKLKVQFSSCDCPVGFQPQTSKHTKCVCECDADLSSYVTDCNPKSEMISRKGNAWITYINASGSNFSNGHSNSYLIYPHCPLDYCIPPSKNTKINLNVPNGSDAQCANHRSGILCGVCQPGFSLSLGSSHCISCPRYWPVIFVVIVVTAFLAGFLMVIILLALNLTVAVGTLNGIIFYANILAANSSTFSISQHAFSAVIVSWLNMDFGIDACFIKGMNTFTKTWTQLIFPTYVILLVIIVILVSKFSMRFSALIGKKNPVATLATLILLSYAKLLNVIITVLSCATLEYGHQRKLAWLPDATIDYFKSRHASLFMVAIMILIIGIFYTALLFSWQWLHYLHNWKVFNWLLRKQKLSLFIETYHAPYNPKSRYWTGFLLFVRVLLYISAAANLSGDPKMNLLIIGVVMVGIILLKLTTCQVYRKRQVDLIESLCYINLIVLCLTTYFTLDNEEAKAAIATTSVSITLLLVFGIISYHIYMECTTGSKLTQLLPLTQQSVLLHEFTTTVTTSVIDKPEEGSGPALVSGCHSSNTLREPLLNESFS